MCLVASDVERCRAARLIIRAKKLLFSANRAELGGSVKRLYFRGDAAFMRLRNHIDAETQKLVETSNADTRGWRRHRGPSPRLSEHRHGTLRL